MGTVEPMSDWISKHIEQTCTINVGSVDSHENYPSPFRSRAHASVSPKPAATQVARKLQISASH